jgi:hypothetical protein
VEPGADESDDVAGADVVAAVVGAEAPDDVELLEQPATAAAAASAATPAVAR